MLQPGLRKTASGAFFMYRTATIYVSLAYISLELQQLIVHSTRPELHYGNHNFPHSRTADDLGFLWYANSIV